MMDKEMNHFIKYIHLMDLMIRLLLMLEEAEEDMEVRVVMVRKAKVEEME
jgi:hypothetical protein